jgi:uncharacterized damage-inducible protein DinB
MDRQYPRPQAGEYLPPMLEYISLVPEDGLILKHLADGLQRVEALARSRSQEALTTPHKAGEWSIQDVIQHVMDTERVWAYRLLRFARGDTTDLPGFEQEPYAAAANANARLIDELMAEYRAVRASTICLIASLPDEALERGGTQGGIPVRARTFVYTIAGHELYHLRSIRENYG